MRRASMTAHLRTLTRRFALNPFPQESLLHSRHHPRIGLIHDVYGLPSFFCFCNGDCQMKPVNRDLVKIRKLIEAIKEAKIAGYINPVVADWVLEELKEGTA